MTVWIATIKGNEYDAEPWILGAYSTLEKARKAVLNEIRELDLDAPVLSLEIYDSQEVEPNYLWEIFDIEIDK